MGQLSDGPGTKSPAILRRESFVPASRRPRQIAMGMLVACFAYLWFGSLGRFEGLRAAADPVEPDPPVAVSWTAPELTPAGSCFAASADVVVPLAAFRIPGFGIGLYRVGGVLY